MAIRTLHCRQPQSARAGVCPIPDTAGAFAIVPSNDMAAAIAFWARLGFARTDGGDQYAIMTGSGCEVHVTHAGDGPWRVPAEHNAFGVFLRTPAVEAIAARVDARSFDRAESCDIANGASMKSELPQSQATMR